ncbi:MAG: hypothetical protein IKV54_03350 [Clostridia bacterium]|nr:hypothetical protein [Clostridia bacterium]
MFDFNVLLSTLPYMAKGMVGIFVVTALIVLSVVILNKVTSLGENTNDQGENK